MIYFVREPLSRRVKIGVSDTPWARLAQIQTGCPIDLELVGVIEGDEATEAEYHVRFAAYHVRGEWFSETAELADFIATLTPPERARKRDLKEAKTPLDAWMMANSVRNADFAKRFGFGEPFISHMRNGRRQPTLDVAVAMADYTGLHPRDFIVIADGRIERQAA